MRLSLPVRRFIQSTTKTEAPTVRFGTLQWVLARPLYRFQTFDMAQVPAKKRAQALRLELAQWTPFTNTAYFIGWTGHQALVWGWDADKVRQAIVAQRLKPQQVTVLPESVLQLPIEGGLCLTQCAEGFEAQQWRDGQLLRSRWLAQAPTAEEWLMFQRDAGTLPDAQQAQPPAPRPFQLSHQPWLHESALHSDGGNRFEPLILVLASLLLLAPTLWYGFSLLKLRTSTAQLQEQQAQLQREAQPILAARGQALDHQARVSALLALDSYPSQLTLMTKVAQLLPNDKSYLKGWEFQQGQLKLTVTSGADISSTFLIGALQQAGPFRDVKAIAGPDPKSVTFQTTVVSP